MTVKERTLLFNVLIGIFNVALGLLICGFLVIASAFFLAGMSEDARQSVPVGVILPFLLIAGLFASIAISRSAIIFVLDHFNLRDKLDIKMTSRYPSKKKISG